MLTTHPYAELKDSLFDIKRCSSHGGIVNGFDQIPTASTDEYIHLSEGKNSPPRQTCNHFTSVAYALLTLNMTSVQNKTKQQSYTIVFTGFHNFRASASKVCSGQVKCHKPETDKDRPFKKHILTSLSLPSPPPPPLCPPLPLPLH